MLELCKSYSFLFQDIKYIEKLKQNNSKSERSISVKFLNDLEEINVLLKELKEVNVPLILSHNWSKKDFYLLQSFRMSQEGIGYQWEV